GGWRRPRGQIVAELTVGAGRVFRGAAIVIVDLPNPQILVAVSPKSATLGPGETLQLSALITDDGGQAVDLPVDWTVTDQSVGSVSLDGIFTASTHIPSGSARRTQVIAWVTHEGRAYWDFATLRVSGR
ncbi:MAG: Ig-like domain-containing protein, partial [Candidatus Eisenbacteria bacterium]|nr:Ig-like domain-containing protein [Candidatus Eisenbacteria bacterium]